MAKTKTADRRRAIPPSEIKVGKRLREDYGDLDALTDSIREHGLLHPLVLDDANRLVAGHRRLKAVKALGWDVVAVTRVGDLSPDERRLVELEENLQRKDLTPYERSKCTVAVVEQAKKVEAAEALAKGFSAKTAENVRGGRPRKAATQEAAAARAGIRDTTARDAKKHVHAAETFPWMQAKPWNQSQALKAADLMAQLPKRDIPKVEALLTEQHGPVAPKEAVNIIQRMVVLEPEQRKRIYALHKSADDREKSLALTTAAALAPLPDPRATEWNTWAKRARRQVDDYPDDPCNDRILREAERMESLASWINQQHQRKAKKVV